ncbi:hypothetical protein [Streptomyces atratus]|uniref:hypothetical protein n=1 Tax=Streptomyces atratus TaxID=1893 RepID=UPI00364BAE33
MPSAVRAQPPAKIGPGATVQKTAGTIPAPFTSSRASTSTYPPPGPTGAVGRQVVLRSLALGPCVEGEAFAEAVLEGQDGKAVAFDQEPQYALPHDCELVDEVGVLADRDDAGFADDGAQE